MCKKIDSHMEYKILNQILIRFHETFNCPTFKVVLKYIIQNKKINYCILCTIYNKTYFHLTAFERISPFIMCGKTRIGRGVFTKTHSGRGQGRHVT